MQPSVKALSKNNQYLGGYLLNVSIGQLSAWPIGGGGQRSNGKCENLYRIKQPEAVADIRRGGKDWRRGCAARRQTAAHGTGKSGKTHGAASKRQGGGQRNGTRLLVIGIVAAAREMGAIGR